MTVQSTAGVLCEGIAMAKALEVAVAIASLKHGDEH